MFEDGALIIPEPECFFDDVLAKITAEFRTHVDPIPAASKPASVLLVGGFADSLLVQARLSAEFGKMGVHVTTVPAAWQAVIRGAILFALRPQAIRARKMRHAFGYTLIEEWDATLHDAHEVRLAAFSFLRRPSCQLVPSVVSAGWSDNALRQARCTGPAEDHLRR